MFNLGARAKGVGQFGSLGICGYWELGRRIELTSWGEFGWLWRWRNEKARSGPVYSDFFCSLTPSLAQ